MGVKSTQLRSKVMVKQWTPMQGTIGEYIWMSTKVIQYHDLLEVSTGYFILDGACPAYVPVDFLFVQFTKPAFLKCGQECRSKWNCRNIPNVNHRITIRKWMKTGTAYQRSTMSSKIITCILLWKKLQGFGNLRQWVMKSCGQCVPGSRPALERGFVYCVVPVEWPDNELYGLLLPRVGVLVKGKTDSKILIEMGQASPMCEHEKGNVLRTITWEHVSYPLYCDEEGCAWQTHFSVGSLESESKVSMQKYSSTLKGISTPKWKFVWRFFSP